MKYLLLILLLASCSPIKQVLRDPAKTLAVVDAYLKHYPITSEVEYINVPGDSVVSIITHTDTAYIFDSLYVPVESVITKYITRTVNKTDTVVKSVIDRTFQMILQKDLAASKAAIDQLTKDKDELKKDRNKFRLWFWLLVGVIGGSGVLWVYSKIKK